MLTLLIVNLEFLWFLIRSHPSKHQACIKLTQMFSALNAWVCGIAFFIYLSLSIHWLHTSMVADACKFWNCFILQDWGGCLQLQWRKGFNSRISSIFSQAILLLSVVLSMMTINLCVQVLLHLLRAGYFLHKMEQKCSNGGLTSFPIRTIYFESSAAFPEINSFTYDTASRWEALLMCRARSWILVDKMFVQCNVIILGLLETFTR
jgi:hypothetical protein